MYMHTAWYISIPAYYVCTSNCLRRNENIAFNYYCTEKFVNVHSMCLVDSSAKIRPWVSSAVFQYTG